jgi:putative exosortase-associated protein (TIGR04073 family)
MKHLVMVVSFFAFIACFAAPSPAAELAAPGTAARKLQRGFLNIALSPIEISNEIVNYQKADTILPSWIPGMIKGTFRMVGRGVIGAYEMVTAPVPSYEPVVKPEFTWEYLKPLKDSSEKTAS